MKKEICYQKSNSPIGDITVVSYSNSIINILFENQEYVLNEYKEIKKKSSDVIDNCFNQLNEYFFGSLREFNLEIFFSGSNYIKEVHHGLIKYAKYSKTISYSQLANFINMPTSHARSVALACSKNRVQIVVPCHRVLGKNGALTGYAGEIWRKKYLLELEESFIKQKKVQSLF